MPPANTLNGLSHVDVSWVTLERLVDLARRAGDAVLACARPVGELKADGSPVTAADRASQAIICADLTAWDSSIAIAAEEMTLADAASRAGWERYWLIDPLDGTKEFLAGRREFTVNIALIDRSEPVIGVVHAPALRLTYWAGRGLGSWRQAGDQPATRLHVHPPRPEDGVRVVESRSHPSAGMERFVSQVRVISRTPLGSSIKFCWLAEGRADCYPRFGQTMAWDVAAGDCVFRNAAQGLAPHRSGLTYDPRDFRQGPFVVGFAPGFTEGAHAVGVEDAGDVSPGQEPAARGALIVHREQPLNAESRLPRVLDAGVTPNAAFYIRSHFSTPVLTPETYCLRVGGLVERSLCLSLNDLTMMPARTRVLTLECAGNGRTFLSPSADGEPWRYGAVGTAEWTGVALAHVLEHAGVRGGARDVVFRGADVGAVSFGQGSMTFARSLPVTEAATGEALLAYTMNGEPLPRSHGYPLRLVVPGWYGMAWVKWLTEVEVIGESFAGLFQDERYWYEVERGDIARQPVMRQRVRALILEPLPDAVIGNCDLVVRGVAWSGAAPLARVEVAIGDRPWQQVRLIGRSAPFRWQEWEYIPAVCDPGVTIVRARATDLAGRIQPEHAAWNRFGYGNNAVQSVSVRLT